eukprot:EG_transcript_41022
MLRAACQAAMRAFPSPTRSVGCRPFHATPVSLFQPTGALLLKQYLELKILCEACKKVRRNGREEVICWKNTRHRQVKRPFSSRHHMFSWLELKLAHGMNPKTYPPSFARRGGKTRHQSRPFHEDQQPHPLP